MSRQSTTWLQISAYRFWLRRIECALLREDVQTATSRLQAPSASLVVGCLLTALAVATCALVGLLRPHVALERAQIVLVRESGALFVREGDLWHPVPNLASARLVAGTAADPQLVRESDLGGAKRGPLLGIPGAPQFLGALLSAEEAAWSICDGDGAGTTTVIIGRPAQEGVRRLTSAQAILAAPASGSPAYLLYSGHRAVVDLADAAVVRALRLEGRTPRVVSRSLLNAVPEAPPIAAPRIRGLGGAAPSLPGFPVGSVLRVTRADGDEYYAVSVAGVQRIGQVAADLLRFGNPQGVAHVTTVAPDAIRAAPIVAALPVASFPDRAPVLPEGTPSTCVSWEPAQSAHADVAILAGSRLPLLPGQAPVPLAQADGRGPALDAVYLPPGHNAYVRENGGAGTRYLITDAGVRFPIHDEDAAHDLGLIDANPAPWPVLATLPAGPELSRQKASIARDVVTVFP